MALRYKIVNRRKYLLVRWADRLLSLRPASAGKVSLPSSPRRILAIRVAYIGDVVMTLPAIVALRHRFPDAEIDLLTSSGAAQLISGQAGIDHIREFDAPWFYQAQLSVSPAGTRDIVRWIRSRNYEMGFDFRGDIRNIYHLLYRSRIPCRVSYTSGGGGSWLTHGVPWQKQTHKVDYHLNLLRGLGWEITSSDPHLVVSESQQAMFRMWLEKEGLPVKNIAVIHPGARLGLKRWQPQGFAAASRHVAEDFGLHPFVTGGTGEKALCAEVCRLAGVGSNLAGRLTLPQFAALCSMAKIALTNDSAPMHIAAALGTPLVAVFGPSNSRETGPRGNCCRVIEGTYSCRYTCDERVCRERPRGRCLREITVDRVLQALDELMI